MSQLYGKELLQLKCVGSTDTIAHNLYKQRLGLIFMKAGLMAGSQSQGEALDYWRRLVHAPGFYHVTGKWIEDFVLASAEYAHDRGLAAEVAEYSPGIQMGSIDGRARLALPPLVRPEDESKRPEVSQQDSSDMFSTRERRDKSINAYIKVEKCTRAALAKRCGVTYGDLNKWKLHGNSAFAKNTRSGKTQRIEDELSRVLTTSVKIAN